MIMEPLTFNELMQAKEMMELELDCLSKQVQSYPKGNMGLTPDHIRKSEEFQRDKGAFDRSMQRMRKFNSAFMKKYKKEYAQYRANKRKELI